MGSGASGIEPVGASTESFTGRPAPAEAAGLAAVPEERFARWFAKIRAAGEEVTEAEAGNIYAAVGLKDTRTGDTLCDEKKPILLD